MYILVCVKIIEHVSTCVCVWRRSYIFEEKSDPNVFNYTLVVALLQYSFAAPASENAKLKRSRDLLEEIEDELTEIQNKFEDQTEEEEEEVEEEPRELFTAENGEGEHEVPGTIFEYFLYFH